MAYLLDQLLTATAKTHGARAAVVSKTSSLTYLELDRLSTQLAHALRANGVEMGDRVGIYLTKSVESMVALFGALKAGAAYVPLDPAAPVRRVAFIVGNCGIKALVTTQARLAGLAGALPSPSPVRCVVLTDDSRNEVPVANTADVRWSGLRHLPAVPPANDAIEDDLAYVLYTSGSTGDPKGVMISHRASLTFVDWASERFRIRPSDRLSNHAPLHFDLSVFDVFASVKAGATLVLVPEEFSVFPVNLARFIEDQKITVWYSVPSVLTRLLLHGNLKEHRFPDLRAVLFAGEVFPTKYLKELMTQVPHPEYFNLYGPTETNVCTYYQVLDIPAGQVQPISIGKPCENTAAFVVDDNGQLAQLGESGELWVRGPNLMKGYWGLPERSAKSLIANKFMSHWDEKAYRTGDIVRQEPDGNYTFLGRRDNMIKSRGYRIELGEIETVLYTHPDIVEAAVVAVPDDEIGNIIKAVIVHKDGRTLTRGQVEAYCAERIPKYMVPGIIEFMDSLPKTSTGKADRSLLVGAQQEGESAKKG